MHRNEREILRWEQVVTQLAMHAYRQWTTEALTVTLPTLTAGAGPLDNLQPDPAAIGNTETLWTAALEDTILSGLGILVAARMADVFAERGVELPALEPTATAVVPLPSGATPTTGQILTRLPDFAADLLGGQPQETVEYVVKMPTYRDHVDDHLRDVNNRTNDLPDDVFRAITRDLAHGIDEGDGVPELRTRVRNYLDIDTEGGYDRWMNRAERIARTEVTAAYNAATLQAGYTEAQLRDVELDKEWVASMDGRTRKTHFAADGQRRRLDAKFTVGGHDMRYPGDTRAPSREIVNCRCSFVLIEADDTGPNENDRQTERTRSDGTRRNPAGEVARREADGVTRARDDPDNEGHIAAAATGGDTVKTRRKWSGTLAPIGKPTGDGRIFATDIALECREFPLPLMWQKSTDLGHDKSVIVGRIDAAEVKGDLLEASGEWFDSPEADEAATLLEEEVIRPSVDLCDVEWSIVDSDGNEIPEDALMDAWEKGEQIDALECTTAATLMGATMVAKPAFAEAKIQFTGDTVDTEEDGEAALLAAAGTPWQGQAEFFQNPNFKMVTPLTVTKEGRVFGHMAAWDTCHFGIGTTGKCVKPPHSNTDYAYFHVSEIDTDKGRLPVGRLTIGGGHASGRASMAAAAEHYDNVGASWAYVRAGEDEFGIWVSGQIHPSATPEQIREGSGTPLSGDWRKTAGNLELVAALGVVSGGFPIPRGASDDRGSEVSLVAANVVPLSYNKSPRRGMEAFAKSVAEKTVNEFLLAQSRKKKADQMAAQVRASQARRLSAQIRR